MEYPCKPLGLVVQNCLSICVLYSMCLKASYMPKDFTNAVIIPLVKCKTGDLSDVNNYKAIMISTAVSKIYCSQGHVRLSHV